MEKEGNRAREKRNRENRHGNRHKNRERDRKGERERERETPPRNPGVARLGHQDKVVKEKREFRVSLSLRVGAFL